MPSLDFDPGFCGDWLDVMLHDPTHPVRLLASHLRAGEEVVAILGIWSLPTPSQQFFDKHIVQWDALFRSFRLTLPMRCFTIERFGIKTLSSKRMSSQRTPLSSPLR